MCVVETKPCITSGKHYRIEHAGHDAADDAAQEEISQCVYLELSVLGFLLTMNDVMLLVERGHFRGITSFGG